jgi:DNA-binding HxlR family transcriptional regulator
MFHSHPKESDMGDRRSDATTASAAVATDPASPDPAVEALVRQILDQVADKWTMLILETLEEKGTMRFTEIGRAVGDISQKMLTKTLREMERIGLVERTVRPVIPPHVDYALTDLGRSLGEAFCGVWLWAEKNRERIETSRAAFDAAAKARR